MSYGWTIIFIVIALALVGALIEGFRQYRKGTLTTWLDVKFQESKARNKYAWLVLLAALLTIVIMWVLLEVLERTGVIVN